VIIAESPGKRAFRGIEEESEANKTDNSHKAAGQLTRHSRLKPKLGHLTLLFYFPSRCYKVHNLPTRMKNIFLVLVAILFCLGYPSSSTGL